MPPGTSCQRWPRIAPEAVSVEGDSTTVTCVLGASTAFFVISIKCWLVYARYATPASTAATVRLKAAASMAGFHDHLEDGGMRAGIATGTWRGTTGAPLLSCESKIGGACGV